MKEKFHEYEVPTLVILLWWTPYCKNIGDVATLASNRMIYAG